MKSDYLIKIVDHDAEWDGTLVHIRNIGPTDHLTVCGMDGGVSENSQDVVPLERGDKLNCGSCITYYRNRAALNVPKQFIDQGALRRERS